MLRTVEVSREKATEHFKLRLPKSIAAQIKETAKKLNISNNEVIRRMMENHMKQPVRVRPFRPRPEDT